MSKSHSVCLLNGEMFQLGISRWHYVTSFCCSVLCLITEKPDDRRRKYEFFYNCRFGVVKSIKFLQDSLFFSYIFSAAKRILVFVF